MKLKDIPDASMYPGKVKRLALAMMKHGCSSEDALAFIESAKGISERDKPVVVAWFAENLPKLPGELGSKALGCAVKVELVTSSLTTFGKEGCRFLVCVKEEGK